MKKIIKLIKKANSVAILTHISEDADAVGSAMAFDEAMKTMGKTSVIYVSEKPESCLEFLGDNYVIYKKGDIVPQYDLCVSLDSADEKRMGSRIEIFNNAKHTVCIDHHHTNKGFANENFIDGNASSTGEIIYDFLKALRVKITKKIAEYLYASISGDTGSFMYSSTSPKTHKIASELLEKGIDQAYISRMLFDTESKEKIKLEGHIMANIHEYFDGKLCIAVVDKKMLEEFGVEEKELGDIVNIPRKIKGCEIAVSIRENTDKTKMSLRSNGIYDVSLFAVKFNGGGHKMASGVSMECDIEEAEKRIIDFCKENYFKN